jgi:hypothetical protein
VQERNRKRDELSLRNRLLMTSPCPSSSAASAFASASASASASSTAASNLLALESLLTEFFSPVTSNARKAEIESVLSSFTEQSDAWRQSVDFLSRTSNEYVAMFALNSLETVIRRR